MWIALAIEWTVSVVALANAVVAVQSGDVPDCIDITMLQPGRSEQRDGAPFLTHCGGHPLLTPRPKRTFPVS
jgi:hypothetical protein